MKKAIFFLLTFVLFGCDQSPKVTNEEIAAVKEADSRTGMVLETIDESLWPGEIALLKKLVVNDSHACVPGNLS